MRLLSATISGFAVLCVCLVPCRASTIELGINGEVQISSNHIDFGQFPNGAPYASAPGCGNFEVSLVNAGAFAMAGVTTGEFGKIQSLNTTGPLSLSAPFMTFDSGGSNLQLWAMNIPAGGTGPFVMTDTPDGVVASFDVEGYVWNTTTMSKVDTFTGTFSTTFDGMTAADFANATPMMAPFSATFSVVGMPVYIPEPGSLLLLCGGLTGLAVIRRRAKRA